jgi:hypothetical protein
MGLRRLAAVAGMAFALLLLLTVPCCDPGPNDDDSAADDDGDQDDDTGGGENCDDDTEWEEKCGDNSPPELLGLSYEVNGEVVPGPVMVTNEDEVALLIEYSDVDCNLVGGGWFTASGEPIGSGVVHAFDSQVGCSSEEEGAPYGAVVTILDFAAGSGPFRLSFRNGCDADSNILPVLLEWKP